MIRSDFSQSESFPPDGLGTIDQATFSQLYDQYAPALLGVITAIVQNEAEATRLLEATFLRICSQFGQFSPKRQPLFVWLVSIARATALDAVKDQKGSTPSIVKLSDGGKVITDVFTRIDSSTAVPDPPYRISSPLNELLDAVFFQNCTPEEAASVIGLPVATARQQLRLAMQSLRKPPDV